MKVRSLLACLVLAAPLPALAYPCQEICDDVIIPVRLSGDPGAPQYGLSGQLCSADDAIDGTLQVLIHGASYDRRYWDWNRDNSYLCHAVVRGGAVLTIDRLGVGASSRPANPGLLSIFSHAFAINDAVQFIRAGLLQTPRIGEVAPAEIVLVGHSLGAQIATVVSAQFGSVDRLILQGYSHTLGPAAMASFGLAHPAANELRFTDLDPGYLTTVPGSREGLFFAPADVDAATLARDETIKTTYTGAELGTIEPALAVSPGVQVPTLIVLGDQDFITCQPPGCEASGIRAGEPAHFPNADLTIRIVPDAGHSINLHHSADRAYRVMTRWLRRD